jgi:hypothetical protein
MTFYRQGIMHRFKINNARSKEVHAHLWVETYLSCYKTRVKDGMLVLVNVLALAAGYKTATCQIMCFPDHHSSDLPTHNSILAKEAAAVGLPLQVASKIVTNHKCCNFH